MIICVDMGNTDVTLGVYAEEKLIATFRTATDKKKSADEYELFFSSFLIDKHFDKTLITATILASVVPSLTLILKEAITRAFGVAPLILGRKLKTGLPLRIDNPSELGADLVADAVAAVAQYGKPVLVADLGTATKIGVVDQTGAFIGAIIMPGLKLSIAAMIGGTAQLPEISIERPHKVLGKNSPDSMNSGATYGTAAMIKGLADQIDVELGYKCKRVLTGGYAHYVRDLLEGDFDFDPNLVLEGLLNIYHRNEDQTHA